jgi:hypothetical protein
MSIQPNYIITLIVTIFYVLFDLYSYNSYVSHREMIQSSLKIASEKTNEIDEESKILDEYDTIGKMFLDGIIFGLKVGSTKKSEVPSKFKLVTGKILNSELLMSCNNEMCDPIVANYNIPNKLRSVTLGFCKEKNSGIILLSSASILFAEQKNNLELMAAVEKYLKNNTSQQGDFESTILTTEFGVGLLKKLRYKDDACGNVIDYDEVLKNNLNNSS